MRNFMRNEKNKGRHQALKNKLLSRRQMNLEQQQNQQEQPKPNKFDGEIKITLTDTVKSKIREVLQENLRKSIRNKSLCEVTNNKISVIKATPDLKLWKNSMNLSVSV